MSKRPWQFVVFSDDWGRHPSSCQHLFRRIARDHRVLWVNTIGLRRPKADAFTVFRGLEKIKGWVRPLTRVGPNMHVLSPVMLPAAGPGLIGRLNRWLVVQQVRQVLRRIGVSRPVLWASVPNAASYVGRLSESAVVYYVTDDYSRWPGADPEAVQFADRLLTEQSDLVMACTEELAATHGNGRRPTLVLPHAVDFEHFSAPGPEPADLSAIPRPRACFFGLIYEKIDTALLARLADQMPDLHLVLIGPIRSDVTGLKKRRNVHLLGPRSYEDLPAYLQAMEILVVPYVCDESIALSGPLKIRECLATGRPTVARAIPSLEQFSDVVRLYRDETEFITCVHQAVAAARGGPSARMQARVRGESWEARVATVIDSLAALSDGQMRQPDCGAVSRAP